MSGSPSSGLSSLLDLRYRRLKQVHKDKGVLELGRKCLKYDLGQVVGLRVSCGALEAGVQRLHAATRGL